MTDATPQGSRNAECSFDWADRSYRFRLGIGMLRELQEKTGAGPLELLRRIQAGAWRVDDLRETIRCGLIGGGLAPGEALRLVRLYVEERPLGESTYPAIMILAAAVFGVPDEAPGKRRPARKTADRSTTAASASPVSTPSAP